MVEQSKWPAGIRPKGAGIEVRVRRSGYNYQQIINGNAYKKTDLAAAVRHRNEIISRIKLGLPVYANERTTVTLFADDAQRYADQLELEFSTASDYLNMLENYWLPVFGNHITQEISTDQIKQIMTGDGSTSYSRWYKRLTPLRGIFDLAGIVPNPADGIKSKQASHKKNKNEVIRFRPNQRAAIMAELSKNSDPQIAAYFALLYGCGMRPGGEPLGLEWIDYDGQEIYIHQTRVRGRLKQTTKTHRTRRVFVPQWVRPYLDNLPSRFKDGFIFIHERGGPYKTTHAFNDAWQAVFQTVHIRRDLKIAYQIPYVCRHTRAAELLSTGVESGRAAAQLGHSLAMFEQIYSEWIEEYSKHSDKSQLDSPGPIQTPQNIFGPKLGQIGEK